MDTTQAVGVDIYRCQQSMLKTLYFDLCHTKPYQIYMLYVILYIARQCFSSRAS